MCCRAVVDSLDPGVDLMLTGLVMPLTLPRPVKRLLFGYPYTVF